MGFPYGCICRKNFFDKIETTDTTDTTIWKPGFTQTVVYLHCEICISSSAKYKIYCTFYKVKLLLLIIRHSTFVQKYLRKH